MKKYRLAVILIFTVLLCAAISACGYFVFPTYRMEFYVGDDLVCSYETRTPESVRYPDVALDDGYEIETWQETEGEEIVKQDVLQIIKRFQAVRRAIEYNVSYELNGGVNAVENLDTYTVESEFTLADASKDGYDFIGWTSETHTSPVKGLEIAKGTKGDLTFTAEFVDPNLKYLYFDSNGGTAAEREVSSLGVFDEMPSVSREGYEFDGWYLDDKLTYKAVFPLIATEKITTVYAKWSPIVYHVYSVGGEFETLDYTIETETFALVAPEKTGYDFIGFAEDGKSETTENFIIPKGSHKDYYIICRYSPKNYEITFETFGGSEVEKIVAAYGSAISAPDEPTKQYCDFLGWFLEPKCVNQFEFTTMPAKNFTLYADWYSDKNFTLNFSADGATISSNKIDGGKVVAGETVVLTAPPYADGKLFSCWSCGGELYSYDNALVFEMPIGDLSLVANYSEIDTLSYDRSVGGSLTVYASESVTALDGVGLTVGDYSVSGKKAVISETFLTKLADGYYPLSVTTQDGMLYFTLKIYSSASVLKGAKIDYDIAYPEVVLTVDGAESGSYEYSLDGAAYIPIDKSAVLDDYDKSVSHTVTVRNADDPTDNFTVSKDGYKNYEESFVNSGFEYGGRSYDRFIESEEEFFTCMEYVLYVYAPTFRADSEYDGGSATYQFCCSREFYDEFSASPEDYFSLCFARSGTPYAPRCNYSYSPRSVSVTVNFKTDEPNEVRSSQSDVSVSDAQKLLKKSSRSDDYDGFKINSFALEQEIRTLYELENLPFGVRPKFSSTDGQAYEVYQRALAILREYVDDGMSDFEKALAIYDYLSLTVTYDDVAAAAAADADVGKYRSFTTYGALVDKLAVCDGIAGAFSLLCRIEGIECIEVSGLGNGGAHAWNKVRLGGLWYSVDATWSHVKCSETNLVSHKFFAMDEYDCISYGHEENGTLADDEKYVDNCAISPLNYFNATILDGSLDHTAESTSDFTKILKAHIDDGATAVELKLSGFDIDTALAVASIRLHFYDKSVYALDDDIYIVILN